MDNELNFRNFLEKNVIQGGKRLINGSNVNSKPLFSIITVVYNNERFLEETIKSVLKQKFQNFEYIIIDGGSSDKTLDIIKRYDRQIDYWISEKDKGIYDAFNKGMSLAKGDFIGIVNSDDTYMDNALEIIAKYIKELNNKEIDFIFGSVKKHWGVLYGYRPEKIYYSWGFYSSHSTGFFLRRSSAKKIGLYNINYKYHADYDYFYRMIVKKKMKGISTKKNEIIGYFRPGGFYDNLKYIDYLNENTQIRLHNNQNLFLVMLIHFLRYIKRWKLIKKQSKE